MDIEEIAPEIYRVKNFISKDTAKFIVDSLPHSIMGKAPNGNTYGYFSVMYPKYLTKISNYNDNANHNIAVDILFGLTMHIGDIMDYAYEQKHVLKQTCYSEMLVGGFNGMHTDNSEIDEAGNILYRGPDGNWAHDKSGLVYFTEDYEGGLLRFPEQGLELKPEVGTLIFFEGTYARPHEVTNVTDGVRCNLITFYEPTTLSKTTLFNR